MNFIELNAPAKINISLDITGILENGYHQMNMIMQSVSLCDKVKVSKCDKNGIFIKCDNPSVPCNESNIAHKVADRFFKLNNINNYGVQIEIHKRIPSQAGLGGGSADGAAVLVALNKLYQTEMTTQDLCNLGAKVGADIPFCIVGGTALVQGIGEELTRIDDMPDCIIVIAKPDKGVNTKLAFEKFDQLQNVQHPNTEMLLNGFKNSDLAQICSNMLNVLQPVCDVDEANIICDKMTHYGALGWMMTGSGSAVFGIFTDQMQAQMCQNELSNNFFCVTCKPTKSCYNI